MNLFGNSNSANQITRTVGSGINIVATTDKFLNYDRTDGNVILNLPKISDFIDIATKSGNLDILNIILSDVTPSPSLNTVTLVCDAVDNINGSPSFVATSLLNLALQPTPSGWLLISKSSSSNTPIPNNPYDFYLDGSVSVGGDGSIENPFKTLTELNNAVLALPTSNQYVANILPYDNYGAEVVGDLDIAENLSLVGIVALNTLINCSIKLTASGSIVVASQFKQLAFNSTFKLDLSLAPFAFVSITDGQINIDRIDNNANGTIILNGGILGSTISGGEVIIKDGIVFVDVNIFDGATVYTSNTLLKGGKFNLTGNCTLKTLSVYNPQPDYVNGTVDGSGTPTWLTDSASNESYTGTVNKTVY